jgi:hypothetical protein
MMKLFVALVTGSDCLRGRLFGSHLSVCCARLDRSEQRCGRGARDRDSEVLAPGAKVWEFDIAMDTYTKPLIENLAQAAVLMDDAGRRCYTPRSWQGDPPGGHHRKGILQFTGPAERPATVELQIVGIGSPATRTFRWELNSLNAPLSRRGRNKFATTSINRIVFSYAPHTQHDRFHRVRSGA